MIDVRPRLSQIWVLGLSSHISNLFYNCIYVTIDKMQRLFSTSQVAAMAGIHRDTLLRWLRNHTIQEPSRDHRGWRVFSAEETASIVAFAKGYERNAAKAIPIEGEVAIDRLNAIEWDFVNAKTSYLTHGLHPYPAKFIPQIPNALIQELSSVGEVIGDIFCGSGTTLLEALQLKRHAIGIDANPLACLISKAKTTTLKQIDFDILSAHRNSCEELLISTSPPTGDLSKISEPFISTAWRPSQEICSFWFYPHVVEELAEIRSLIKNLPSEVCRTICFVAFAAIIVVSSKQDSDTRYVRRSKVIEPGDTVRRYLKQIDTSVTAAKEVSDLVEDRFSCQIVNADILDAPDIGQFDLLVSSPPYPNAYSYHLYHRIRLLWLGFDPELFKKIEIGSHRKYSSKGRNRATPDTFRKEFERIFLWLRDRLRNGRYACFVIGDSTIDGSQIDNSTILVNAATVAGFKEVTRISRTIASTRKAFNPRIGKIKTENVLVLQKV